MTNMDREADEIKTTVCESQKELKEALKDIMDDCDISVKQEEE